MATWREQFRPIIAAAIAEADRLGLEGRERLRHVRAKWPPWRWNPYGERGWVKRVWNDEIRVQLGRKPPRRRKGPEKPTPLFPD